jgi:hypothetical protein
MSHPINLTRSELVQVLETHYSPDESVDLISLQQDFELTRAKVLLTGFLDPLLTSMYLLIDERLGHKVTMPVFVADDLELFAEVLVDYLNEGSINQYLKPEEVLLYSTESEIIQEVLANGNVSDQSKYDPSKIKLVIHVVHGDTELRLSPELPEALADDIVAPIIKLVVGTP